jgi:hypothetical protein
MFGIDAEVTARPRGLDPPPPTFGAQDATIYDALMSGESWARFGQRYRFCGRRVVAAGVTAFVKHCIFHPVITSATLQAR